MTTAPTRATKAQLCDLLNDTIAQRNTALLEDASVNLLIFLAFSLTLLWRTRLSYLFALLLLLPAVGFFWNAIVKLSEPIPPEGVGGLS